MRGKIGLHYGLQRCNAQRAALDTAVLLQMPVYIVADACYTPITGITYGLRRHCLLS